MTSGRCPPPSSGTLDRRRLLIGAGAAALAVGGCSDRESTTRSPASGAGTSTSGSTTAAPPGAEHGAQTEADLADFATAVLHRWDQKLSHADKRLLTLLASAHRTHAAVLHRSDPTATDRSDRPTATASPSGTATPGHIGSSTKKSLAKLQSLEQSGAHQHRARALKPGGPDDHRAALSLLWGSLSVAATGYAATLAEGKARKPRAAARHRKHRHLPDHDHAIQHLVTQTDALIFGFQTALGHLDRKSAKRAQHRMARYRKLRDSASIWLDDHKLDVPQPKPAYRLPVQPTTSRHAAALISTLELAMLPYLGQWMATSPTTGGRTKALHALDHAVSSADTWSRADQVLVWPGWPVS